MTQISNTTEAIIDRNKATIAVDEPPEPDGRVIATVIEVSLNWFGIKSGDRLHFR